jgi:hypothetical protein
MGVGGKAVETGNMVVKHNCAPSRDFWIRTQLLQNVGEMSWIADISTALGKLQTWKALCFLEIQHSIQ